MTTAPLSPVKPLCVGPTWQRDPDHPSGWLLPERTVGWAVVAWQSENLRHADGRPWRYTPEQLRFILWWYAVNERGRWMFRDGVLQRLKGWGKDPVAATISATGFVGPARCDMSGRMVLDPWGREHPAGVPHPEAWVQIAAVSKDQTRNTMTLFPSLFTRAAIERYSIDLGKEIIYAHRGAKRIEAVTSSPRALEGGRPTEVIRNETHHWLSSNEGHEMDAVIDRNAVKSADGASRALSITNAYEPSEDSVAQRAREAWESVQEGRSLASGILYDSLEAPPDAPLTASAAPAVVKAIRGDSTWLDVDRIVSAILDPRNPPSRSRRFWYNQIVAAEDAWLTPQDVDATVVTEPVVVGPEEEIVAFFDGSKSDDATALVGCRVSDGFVFTLGVWQRPHGERAKGWLVPRAEVNAAVDDMFASHQVVAFFGDPSHVKDDEDDTRYWDGLLDEWHQRYSGRLRLWSVQSGHSRHAVMWDMASPERVRLFTEAAQRFVTEIEQREFTHDGHPALVQHLKNARRYPNRFGVSLWKGHRESPRKVDLAVCAVGARMVRRLVLNTDPPDKKVRTGRVYGFS